MVSLSRILLVLNANLGKHSDLGDLLDLRSSRACVTGY